MHHNELANLVAYARHLDELGFIRQADEIDSRIAQTNLNTISPDYPNGYSSSSGDNDPFAEPEAPTQYPIAPVKDFSELGISPEEMQQTMLDLKGVKTLTPDQVTEMGSDYNLGRANHHHFWVYPNGNAVHLPGYHGTMIGLHKHRMRDKYPNVIADYYDADDQFVKSNPKIPSDSYKYFITGSGGSIRAYISGNSLDCIIYGVPKDEQFQQLENLKHKFGLKRISIDYYDNNDTSHYFSTLEELRNFLIKNQGSTKLEENRYVSPLTPFLHDERLWRMSKKTLAYQDEEPSYYDSNGNYSPPDVTPEPVQDYSQQGIPPWHMQYFMSTLPGVKHMSDDELSEMGQDHKYGAYSMWVYPPEKPGDRAEVVKLPRHHGEMVDQLQWGDDFLHEHPNAARQIFPSDPYKYFIRGSGGSIRVYICDNSLNATAMGIPSPEQLDQLVNLKHKFGLKVIYITYMGKSGGYKDFDSVDEFRNFLSQYKDPNAPTQYSGQNRQYVSPLTPFLHDERLWRMSQKKLAYEENDEDNDYMKPEPIQDFSEHGIEPQQMRSYMSSIPDTKHMSDQDMNEFQQQYDPEHSWRSFWLYPSEAPGKKPDLVQIPQHHWHSINALKSNPEYRSKARYLDYGTLPDDDYEFFIRGSGGSIRVFLDGGEMYCSTMGLPSSEQLDRLTELKNKLNLPYVSIDYKSATTGKSTEFKSIDNFRAFLSKHESYKDATPARQYVSPLTPFLHDSRLWRMSAKQNFTNAPKIGDSKRSFRADIPVPEPLEDLSYAGIDPQQMRDHMSAVPGVNMASDEYVKNLPDLGNNWDHTGYGFWIYPNPNNEPVDQMAHIPTSHYNSLQAILKNKTGFHNENPNVNWKALPPMDEYETFIRGSGGSIRARVVDGSVMFTIMGIPDQSQIQKMYDLQQKFNVPDRWVLISYISADGIREKDFHGINEFVGFLSKYQPENKKASVKSTFKRVA